MRRWFQGLLVRTARRLNPGPDFQTQTKDLQADNKAIKGLLDDQIARDSRQDALERIAELVEARQMAGSGPWSVSPAALRQTDNLITETMRRIESPVPLRETNTIVGATADINLMLENVEWRREVNLSWLEFSRWGIQQIILISRLYFIKNPIIRRLIDISSAYVFGRGVEVSTDDDTANAVLQDFFERNKSVLGQIALVELEKRKYYDGNLFFAFFADTQETGDVNVRTIDATEIQDIITNPEDADEPWFYHRIWTQRNFDPKTGARAEMQGTKCWYPALKYSQSPFADRSIKQIQGVPVRWDVPVLHRKCGSVGKWLFGCPTIYPALDWAKAARRLLEDCATIRRALARIAVTLTTKGGQQALEGAKNQLQTGVNTDGNPIWDPNPPPVTGAIFASGTGTKLEAFKTAGTGGNPEDARQYKLMCCMVVGVPETFLADVSTGNLATATTLDRPTELVFLEKQEAWREDLVTIAEFVLKASKGATAGKLKESLNGLKIRILENERLRQLNGNWIYEKKKPVDGEIRVKCTFPAIREGDMAANVKAIVEAMTLDNKGGQIVGIDEKTGVGLIYEQLGVENSDEILEEQYPKGEYDPDRTKEDLPAPIGKATPNPGGEPQLEPDGEERPVVDKTVK